MGLGVSLYRSRAGFLWRLLVDTFLLCCWQSLGSNQQRLIRRWWPSSGILLLLKEEAVPNASDCSGYPPVQALNERRQNSILFQRTAIASMEGEKTPRPRANSTTSCTCSNFKLMGSTKVCNFFSSRDCDLRRCWWKNGLDPLIVYPGYLSLYPWCFSSHCTRSVAIGSYMGGKLRSLCSVSVPLLLTWENGWWLGVL